MRASWAPTALWLVTCLFADSAQGLVSSRREPVPDHIVRLENRNVDSEAANLGKDQPVEFLWRAENRLTVKNIKDNGGVHALSVEAALRGFTNFRSDEKNYRHSSLSKLTEKADSGDAIRRNSFYIEASSNPSLLDHEGTDRLSHRGWGETTAPPTTAFFKIRTDAKVIDLSRSLGETGVEDYCVVGHIPFDQYVGWYDLSKAEVRAELLKPENVEKLKRGEDLPCFTRNEAYNANKYRTPGTSGPQPQLAGWPRNHAKWEDPMFKPFKFQNAAENLENFVKTKIREPLLRGGIWEWARTAPLRFDPRNRGVILTHWPHMMPGIDDISRQYEKAFQSHSYDYETWARLESDLSDVVSDASTWLKVSTEFFRGNIPDHVFYSLEEVEEGTEEFTNRLKRARGSLARARNLKALISARKLLDKSNQSPSTDTLKRAIANAKQQKQTLQKLSAREKQISDLLDQKSSAPALELAELKLTLDLHSMSKTEENRACLQRELDTLREEIKIYENYEEELVVKLNQLEEALKRPMVVQEQAPGSSNSQEDPKATEDATQSNSQTKQEMKGPGVNCLEARSLSTSLPEDCVPLNAQDKSTGHNGETQSKAIGPVEEESIAESKWNSIARDAESISQEEFVALMKAHGMSQISKDWQARGISTLSDIRTKILGYKPLVSTSPELRAVAKTVGGWKKGLATTGRVAGRLMYGTSIYVAFTTNSTTLDKAAAVTSIFNFLGCAVGAAADLEKGRTSVMDKIDTSLCFVGDGLIYRGQVYYGALVHLARFVLRQYKPTPKPPSPQDTRADRDRLWTDFIHNDVYKQIRSTNDTSSDQSFASLINKTLDSVAWGTFSGAAGAIGALTATSKNTAAEQNVEITSAKNGTEKWRGDDMARLLQSGKTSHEIADEIRQSAPTWAVRNQRDMLLSIPFDVINGNASGLKAIGDKFNQLFIKNITSEENIEKYSADWFQHWFHKDMDLMSTPGYLMPMPNPFPRPTQTLDRLGFARQKLNEVAKYLNETPVHIPDPLFVAFIVGESKGLDNIKQDVLSAQGYIRQAIQEIMPEKNITEEDLPSAYVEMLAIRHTSDVLDVLSNRLRSDEVSTVFPIDGPQFRENLHALTAMRYGKYWDKKMVQETEQAKAEANKREGTSARRQYAEDDLQIPPVLKHTDKGVMLRILLDLKDDVPQAQYDGSKNDVLLKETQRIRENLERLRNEL